MSSSLLNIWARGMPNDQLTPKASAQAGTSTETDPFDCLAAHSRLHSRRSSHNSLVDSVSSPSEPSSVLHDASGLRTPMPASPSPHPSTPGFPATPSAPISKGLAASALKALAQSPRPAEFSFTTNPLNRTKTALPHSHIPPLSPSGFPSSRATSRTPSRSTSIISDTSRLVDAIANVPPIASPPDPQLSASLVSRALSASPVEDTSACPPSNSLAQPPKGLLSLKIISARALTCSPSHSRPYVVAQFDNNEFVSREPIGEEEEEVRGMVSQPATRPSPSHAKSRSIDVNVYNNIRPTQDTTIGTDGKGPPSQVLSNGNGLFCLSGQNPIWKQEVDFDVAQHEHLHASHRTLHVSVYDRSIGDTSIPDDSHLSVSTPGIEGVELFLGETEIELNFDELVKHNGWFDQWYKYAVFSWQAVFDFCSRPDSIIRLGTQSAAFTGEIRIQLKYIKVNSKKGLCVQDFEFLKMIGKGTFGRVFQVRKKDTKRIYAMKVLSKKEVIDKKEVEHTIGERNILQQSNSCPFLLGLKFSFQSPGELFLVMDYKSGGELFHHLQKEGRFTEERARFYTAEIVLALEHLHTYNIVYRDLKPENILLDATGHIVLCDFGLSKPNLSPDELTTTFCGTTEYLAPEVLLDDHGYSKLVDFWSLGVLLFEMCCGWSPFYAEDNQQMYKNICFGKIKFPRGVIGDDGKQFVKGLLNRNPKHRLGAQNDAADLKAHAFFKSIDWALLASRQIVPSFKPYIDSDDSVVNFDAEFTQLDINDELPITMRFDEADRSADWVAWAAASSSSSVKAVGVPRRSEDSMQDHFRGFSYHGESEMAAAAQSKFGMSSIRD